MRTEGLAVAAGNGDQAAAWDGDEGAEWAAHADFYDGAVRRHHARLMSAAAIDAATRVLDVGCGNGQAARDAARAASSGQVVGIDLSSQMLAVASAAAAAEGLTNVSFVRGDAEIYPFPTGSYDVVISRFAAMFFGDQHAAFANLRRALRPGGRLAVMSWQAPVANEWFATIVGALTLGRDVPSPPPGASGPFAHADPDWTSALLAGAGFDDIALISVEEPMYFGRHADEGFGRLSSSLGWMMAGLDDSQRRQALDDLSTALVAHEGADGVAFGSAAWLITATATDARPDT